MAPLSANITGAIHGPSGLSMFVMLPQGKSNLKHPKSSIISMSL